MRIPRVSIGLPVYNGEKYLRPAVDSILQQDYTDFELIICDNASTDATPAICQEYAAKDPRIRYSRNTVNIGASGNYNRTFELARGEFFKWAAHDDIHLPRFLSRCLEVFNHAPADVVLVAPRTEIIDAEGRSLSTMAERLHIPESHAYQRVNRLLREVQWATAQFGLMRARALKKTRLIDRFHLCDYVLLVELAMLGQIWEIPEVLFQRRWHESISTKLNTSEAQFAAWFDPLYQMKFRDRFITPRMKVGLEVMRSIHRLPLAHRERLRCYCATASAWYIGHAPQLVGDYAIGFRNLIRRSFSASA
jgi:glycosyltransferase involved in cell wall biosynthesis